jgi:epoxyqueuosine reductase
VSPNASSLKRDLLDQARQLGFELAGIAPAAPSETRAAYEEWLAAGHAGEMHYLGRDPVRRADPRRVWPDTGSILVVGLNYRSEEPSGTDDPLRGQVARYAVGDDYHDVLVEKLKALLEWVTAETAGAVQGRYYVDTGPLLERDLARRAGLGWVGKNTMLLNRQQGSYFFLGALLLSVELPADDPVSAHCGSCSACISACPTGALLSPYVLDARRCISYLTIELRGPIPRELRSLIGNWIFGCDLCQEVCPWNRKAAWSTEPAFQPRAALRTPELIPLLEMSQEEFSATFRRSPVKRTKRRGLLRNVCVALGNSGDAAAIPPLLRALAHEEPLVRGHAAWALGQLGAREAAAELHVLAASDPDEWVREEAEAALCTLSLPEAQLAGVG